MSKKKIPLAILEILEPYLSKGIDSIKIVNPGNGLLKFIDADEKSEFYLFIEKARIQNNMLNLLVDKKPASKDSISNSPAWIEALTFDKYFNAWVDLLNRYNNIKSIYDDPIEKKYQDEFYSEYEIIDDDANYNSFTLKQQLWLDNYLENIILVIDQHDPGKTDKILQDIKNMSHELKSNLTKLPKKIIVKNLSAIWAKARKYGLPVLKEIYLEFQKELIKQLVQGQLLK